MTWGPGRAEVDTLLEGGELERVTADSDLAVRLLADSARHIGSARSAAALGDLTGAYQLAYDALRKAAAALLAAQGLRATSRGGHIAIQDAVESSSGDQGRPSVRSAGSGATATLTSTRTPTRPAPTWVTSTTRWRYRGTPWRPPTP